MSYTDTVSSSSLLQSDKSRSEWSDSSADSDFEPAYHGDEDGEDLNGDSGAYEDAEDGISTPTPKAKGKGRAYTANKTTSPPMSPTQSPTETFTRSSPQEQRSRSWTDLNMSIVVALISPIGNWLTGSDHVKHLCLLLLLIYYLHQLIEVPWQLYHKSRTRTTSIENLPSGVDTVKEAANHTAQLALSELRRLEVFYLLLSVLAPFLGAQLIRHIFGAMEVDSLSWFSQTLFVLATGVRPWSHLIERLQQRSSHLQDTLNVSYDEDRQKSIEKTLDGILSRLETLEESVQDARGTADQMETTKEMYEDLTQAVGDLDRLVHRHIKKTELAHVVWNERLTVLETGLQRVEERSKRNRALRYPASVETERYLHRELSLFTRVKHFLRRLSEVILSYLPSYLLKERPRLSRASSSSGPAPSPPSSAPQLSPSNTSIPSPSSGMAMPFFNGTPLETIPEDSDSEETYVSETSPLSPSSSTIKLKPLDRSRSRSLSASRKKSEDSSYRGSKAIELAASVAGWPYRVAASMLTSVLPNSLR